MKLSEELAWRGFIQQSTFADLSELDVQKRVFYHGFDASADSQTIGNLAAMMFDKVFMRHGWKAVILAGGATSLIGDPGGKDKERILQTEETIAQNVKSAEAQLQKIFGDMDFTLVNNIDWTKNMTILEFLRDIGKHFSMTPLVQRDYIAQRIGEGGSGISFTEFSYTLLQGMDFLHLFDTYNVTLQLGGSDQWGNCLSGVELIRKARGAEVHTITLPLIINKATGKKFGKSEDGAVWLDSKKTSVYKFYQFWINVDDAGVEDYIKIYTELDKPSVDKIIEVHTKDQSARTAQRRLAYEVTKIVHGEAAAERAVKMSEDIYARSFDDWSETDFESLYEDIPHADLKQGMDVLDGLVVAGVLSSKSEGRRLIAQKGLVNELTHTHLTEDNIIANANDSVHGYVIISKGKKNISMLKIVEN